MPGPSSSICSSTVVAVRRQRHDDRAAARREADGILQHVLQDNLEHAPAGAHDDALVEPADQADVAARDDLAEMERRLADELGEIGSARAAPRSGRRC